MKREIAAGQRKETLLAQVIPGRASTKEQKYPTTLDISTAALSHGKSVVALEIARGASGKQFLLRGSTPAALAHLAGQIQGSFPQAQIRRRDHRTDPLRIEAGEEVTVMELLPGTAAHQSLRLWGGGGYAGRQQQGGIDPLLGILSALDHLPEGGRAVAQLVLSPLPSTWGKSYQRLAFEHPLAAERERAQQVRQRQYRSGRSSVSWGTILAMGLFAALLIAWPHLRRSGFLPAFVVAAVEEVLAGRMPVFTTEQSVILLGIGMGTAIVLALLTGLMRLLLSQLGHKPLYDPKRVADKISKSAYRTRIRLYVISSCPTPEKAEQQNTSAHPGEREPQKRKAGKFIRGKRGWSLPRVGQGLPLWLSPVTLSRRIVYWWQRSQKAKQRCQERKGVLLQLVAAYRAYHADAYFVPRLLSARRAGRLMAPGAATGFGRVQEALWATDIWGAKMVLSSEEVASLWHLPQASDASELTWLERSEERSLLVPHTLTENATGGWPLGISSHAGQEAQVLLPANALTRHALCLGRTGKGKSTLFQHFALAQLSLGTGGLCVMEPHGDLIARVLELIPSERAEEVTLINLADRMFPPGVNPLDMTQQTDVDRATSTLLGTLKAIWSQSGAWGARQENALRMGIRTLLEANRDMISELGEPGHNQQYTVLDIVPLFEYNGFRRRVLARVSDIYLRNWWFGFFERLEPSNQDDITTPIITKISAYSSSEASRRILGQPVSTINFPDVVRRGGILLINTSSGQVGRDVSSLLGATLLSFFSEALSHQLTQARSERRNWLMLIDEFSNYPVNYEYLLSEMRKAGLSLTLAAQSLSQLDKQDETLRPTVFALSGEDAYLSLRELGSTLTTEDIVKQADLSCYVRLSQQGKPLPLFSMHLSLPPVGDPTTASSILARSRKQGRPAKEVDALLWALAGRHTPFSKRSGEGGASTTEEGEEEDDGGTKTSPPPSSPPGGTGGGRQGGNRERKQSGKSQNKRGSSHHQSGEGAFSR